MSNCTQILQKFQKKIQMVDGSGPTEWMGGGRPAPALGTTAGDAVRAGGQQRPRRGGRPGTAAPAPGPGRRPGSYATEAAGSKPVPGRRRAGPM